MVTRHAITALALALPTLAQAQAGGPDLLQEIYRDWQVRCEMVSVAEGAEPVRLCELAQEVTQAESGQRFINTALEATGNGAAQMTLLAPFGLDLATGITVQTAAGESTRLAFRTCLPVGCGATALLDAPTVNRLAEAETLELSMATDGGQPASATLSLAGFSDGWARLQVLATE